MLEEGIGFTSLADCRGAAERLKRNTLSEPSEDMRCIQVSSAVKDNRPRPTFPLLFIDLVMLRSASCMTYIQDDFSQTILGLKLVLIYEKILERPAKG